MAKTTSIVVILAGIMAAAACDKAEVPAPLNRIEGVTYFTPSMWKETMVDGAALLQAPDGIGMYAPSIILSSGGKPVTRQMADKSYAQYKSNPYNRMSSLEKATIGAGMGWSYSWSYVDKIARTLPRPKTGDYPLDVEHVATSIMLDVDGRAFHIHYKCPTALSDKYKPDFERFLASLKFDAKQP